MTILWQTRTRVPSLDSPPCGPAECWSQYSHISDKMVQLISSLTAVSFACFEKSNLSINDPNMFTLADEQKNITYDRISSHKLHPFYCISRYSVKYSSEPKIMAIETTPCSFCDCVPSRNLALWSFCNNLTKVYEL